MAGLFSDWGKNPEEQKGIVIGSPKRKEVRQLRKGKRAKGIVVGGIGYDKRRKPKYEPAGGIETGTTYKPVKAGGISYGARAKPIKAGGISYTKRKVAEPKPAGGISYGEPHKATKESFVPSAVSGVTVIGGNPKQAKEIAKAENRRIKQIEKAEKRRLKAIIKANEKKKADEKRRVKKWQRSYSMKRHSPLAKRLRKLF